MRKDRKSGFTLIEVIIATIILSALVLLAMMALFSATDASTKAIHASELQERGKRFLAFCRDEMAAGQFGGTICLIAPSPAPGLNLGLCPPPPYPPVAGVPAPTNYLQVPAAISTYDLAVGYQIPGVFDATGKPVASTQVVYGYNCPFKLNLPFSTSPNPAQFIQDLACYLRFEADTVFKESTSSPDAVQALNWDSGNLFPPYPTLTNPTSTNMPNHILKMDLNGDQDTTDTYVRGKIVKYIYAPNGSWVASQHLTGMNLSIVNGGTVTMSPLLLSREVLSDNVMLRVNSSAPGDFYCKFEGHAPSNNPPINHSDETVLFRFVDGSGTVNTAPVASTQLPIDAINSQGILITVVHGDFDGSKKGFIYRMNSELIRFHSGQLGAPAGP